MGTLVNIVLFSTIAGQADDVVLLDFYGTHCGPCKMMEPTIDRLQQAGYPVRKLNIAEHPQLAQQLRVHSVPCFIMVAGGREVSRVNSAVSHDVLVGMFHQVGYRPATAAPAPTRQQQQPTRSATQLPGGYAFASNTNRPTVRPVSHQTSAPSPPKATPASEVQGKAFAASVRIKVSDARGHSYGTGTIIDSHSDDALVLTCGHIFRTSQGRGDIAVDLFVNGHARTVRGELISYQADKNDIGLISIKPGVKVPTARVATAAARPSVGDTVFSIGCDNGADPTIKMSRITAINKYLGFPNIEVAGQPVNGRSGGGLFAADGSLIGVCNAADDIDNEGIYAGLKTVHQQLASVGQQALFQHNIQLASNATSRQPGHTAHPQRLDSLNDTLDAAESSVRQFAAGQGWTVNADDAVRQVSTNAKGLVRQAVASATNHPRVIYVAPGSENGDGQPRIVVVEQPSDTLLRRIESESHQKNANDFAATEIRRTASRMTPIMRAQSQR